MDRQKVASYFRVNNPEQLGTSATIVEGATAAIYCRTATSAQGESSALDAQEARCRAEATRRGLVVADVYRDLARDMGAHATLLAEWERAGIALIVAGTSVA